MEKLEREKWESESKAHKWKMDFQDLCQTYEVTGCNKQHSIICQPCN